MSCVFINRVRQSSLFNSLRGKFHDILARSHTYNYAAFALQETKLNNNIPFTEFSVNEYTLFRRDRTTNGGGVGIYVRK
jgi:hypothetical protein